ncbi:E3 ubiquitin-protein ligase TRIM35-like [Clupea harengus]|uniref:E3 ubiquitin-protein ligase TRIM35-like n=1 Tax=Clupea harengus TaxID=7950 RepID=A0A6P8G6Y8_CLUHA|nr:E3 ubiquitin-protein ligase TRIM35-like [Clupea harengus]
MADQDDITDRPSPLEEDLTCPICKSIFTNPVLLSCTHSFCKDCLDQAWKNKTRRECPVCRNNCNNEQPIPNRSLNAACESYQRQKGWFGSEAPKMVCGLHNRDFALFCEKDEIPVCTECLPLHCGHKLIPLDQGIPICKGELNIKINILEDKVDSFKRMKRRYENTISFIQDQSETAEKLIRQEFDRLRESLNQDEESRIQALKKEEEQKKQAVKEKVDILAKDLASLNDLINNVRKEMGGEDLDFLLNFNKLKHRALWTDEGPQRDPAELIHVAKHTGAVGYKIWEKMQNQVQCLPVIMDPNTISPWLRISPDFSSVMESKERQAFPDNPERFDPCVFVLGSEGFGAGRHRWDVYVGDNPKWVLGICKESVVRKRRFTVTTNGGVWTIGLSKGVYSGLTSPRTELKVDRRPETIRIKLNMDKGQVSFWDKVNGRHLITYTDKFPNRVWPLFGPNLHSTPMKILPSKVTIHQQ